MKTFKSAVKLTITVKRPNGIVEQKVHPTLNYISQADFEIIKKATKEAGKGDVLSYEVEYKDVTGMSKSEMMRAGSDLTVENMSRMGE